MDGLKRESFDFKYQPEATPGADENDRVTNFFDPRKKSKEKVAQEWSCLGFSELF